MTPEWDWVCKEWDLACMEWDWDRNQVYDSPARGLGEVQLHMLETDLESFSYRGGAVTVT